MWFNRWALKRIDGAVGHISLASVFTGIMAKLINHVTGQDMVVKGCWSETKGDPLTIREMCVWGQWSVKNGLIFENRCIFNLSHTHTEKIINTYPFSTGYQCKCVIILFIFFKKKDQIFFSTICAPWHVQMTVTVKWYIPK